MRRDMKLICKLLRFIRCNATGERKNPIDAPDFEPKYTAAEVNYHLGLCAQAGFVELAELVTEGAPYQIVGLTWAGHNKIEEMADG